MTDNLLKKAMGLQQLVMDLIIQAVDVRAKTTDQYTKDQMNKMIAKLGDYINE